MRRAKKERVTDLVNFDRVRGFLRTIYWRRKFLAHRDEKRRILNGHGEGKLPRIIASMPLISRHTRHCSTAHTDDTPTRWRSKPIRRRARSSSITITSRISYRLTLARSATLRFGRCANVAIFVSIESSRFGSAVAIWKHAVFGGCTLPAEFVY